ncbi:MAG: FHA domain-containing protein [Pirellulaceae bacterium]|nr:FHA domain-containing protein [Pirellulaceae bacterium]
MRVVLTVASGTLEGQKILLQPGQTYKIGRTDWADFAVRHDPHMSGLHFAVRCERAGCVLEDLQSTNGTLVNGQSVKQATLQDGDTIRAGHTLFTVQIEQPEAAAAGTVVETPSAESEMVASPVEDSNRPEPVPSQPPTRTIEDLPFASPPPRFADESGPPFDQALRDEDPGVRCEALFAAAWTRQKWLLDYCRWQAEQPVPTHWEAVWMLAVLGKPGDCTLIREVGRNPRLGPERFGVLASFGHPRVVPDLLPAIASEDPAVAVAAGSAFSRITGVDIDSDRFATLPADARSHADDSDSPPPDEVLLPSLELAQQHWDQVKNAFAAGTRWRNGQNLNAGVTAAVLTQLDMQGRWETLLRMHFEGLWQGRPQDTERLRRSQRTA